MTISRQPLDRCLKQVDPLIKTTAEKKEKISKDKPVVTEPSKVLESKASPTKKRKYISKSLRRKVWQDSSGQCTWKDPKSGRTCNERSGLEIEHINPVCHGGTNSPANLTLLCKSHNQLEAIDKLGQMTMGKYINAAAFNRRRE